MPFTDDQFKDFMKIMDHRDLLIRIDENTKNYQKAMIEKMDAHIEQDLIQFVQLNKSQEAAHRRLDKNDNRYYMIIGAAVFVNVFFIFISNWPKVVSFFNNVS